MIWCNRRWKRARAIVRAARMVEHLYAEQSKAVRAFGFAGFGFVYQISRCIMHAGDRLRSLSRGRLEVGRDHAGQVRRWRRPVVR